MKFKDEAHQKFYLDFINKANVKPGDVERKSLFYLLAMFDDTRRHINSLYNFKENRIIPDGLNQPWQTSGTIACTRLAFNLYNSFTGFEEDEASKYSTIDIFAYAGSKLNLEIFLEAIKIRFNASSKEEDSFFPKEESLEEKMKRIGFNKVE